MSSKETLSGCNFVVVRAVEFRNSFTGAQKKIERSLMQYMGTRNYFTQLSAADKYESVGLHGMAQKCREKASYVRRTMREQGYGDPYEIKRQWDLKRQQKPG